MSGCQETAVNAHHGSSAWVAGQLPSTRQAIYSRTIQDAYVNMELSYDDLEHEYIESHDLVTFDWDEISDSAPRYGGVYIMVDEDDQVVYVMKSRNIRRTLLEHWDRRMWEDIFEVRCLDVAAQNREEVYTQLVRKYRPRYNSTDKPFPV